MNIKIDFGGIGFVLFIVFLVLKLCGVIGWSWWWVTSPLWIPLALIVMLFVVLLIIKGVATLVDYIFD